MSVAVRGVIRENIGLSPNVLFLYRPRRYRPLSHLKGKQGGSERITNNDVRRAVRRDPCKGSMRITSQSRVYDELRLQWL